MSATAKSVHVMQFRLTGPTEGLRVLKPITGSHKWRIKLWLKFPDGGTADREILVSNPCALSAITPIYTREIHELCRDESGEPATVTAGGADVYLMPRHSQANSSTNPQTAASARPRSTVRPTLEKGCALLLIGAAGSGKHTLARELARERGPYIEISADDLLSPFQRWMGENIKTVIVEGPPPKGMSSSDLKSLVANDSIRVNRQHEYPVVMKNPNFIFCTSTADGLKEYLGDRRFTVFQVDAQ